MVKLKTEYKDNSIPVSELKDGQIGVITEWGQNSIPLGRIVQMHHTILICIGLESGNTWFCTEHNEYCRVRVLEEGTELIITNNQ